jgi:hypothetical protein
MYIEDSKLWLDIKKIIENTNGSMKNVYHTAVLHTGKMDIPINYINSIDFDCDFGKNVSDFITINFIMAKGTFLKDVYPYRDNLTITLVREIGSEIKTYSYRLFLMNNNNNKESSIETDMSREELDRDGMSDIIAQCIDPVTESLLMSKVGGIYKFTTVESLIYASFKQALDKITINNEAVDIGILITKSPNGKIFNSINVPVGTTPLKLPTDLQNKAYGVYNGDVGTYIREYNDKYGVFVYPLFNKGLFDNSSKKMIVYNMSSMKYDGVENTYSLNGDVLSVITDSSTIIMDNTNNNSSTTGSGYVNSNVKDVMKETSLVTDNTVSTSRIVNISGETSNKNNALGNKSNFVKPSMNNFKYRSSIVRNEAIIVSFRWNYSDKDLIFPGMPVCFITTLGDDIIKYTGVVQKIYSSFDNKTGNVNSMVFLAVYKNDIV